MNKRLEVIGCDIDSEWLVAFDDFDISATLHLHPMGGQRLCTSLSHMTTHCGPRMLFLLPPIIATADTDISSPVLFDLTFSFAACADEPCMTCARGDVMELNGLLSDAVEGPVAVGIVMILT